MLSRGRLAFILVSLFCVFTVVGGTLYAAANRDADDGTDSPYKYLAVFMEVFGLVNKAYVDQPETDQLMSGAFEGTVDALDPFSLYIPAEHVDRYRAATEIGARRSGIVLLKERGVAYAVAVEEGSPADEAGIEAGDILSRIQGLRTRRTPLFELVALLAGPQGTEIEVERLRRGRKEEIRFTLAEYEPPPVVLEARRGVAVIRVPGFYDGTVASLERGLATLREVSVEPGPEDAPSGDLPPRLEGLETTDKLVIDLRGVAGGRAASAYAAAGLFASGELGALLRRDEALEVFSREEEPRFAGEIALLTDRGTQGAGEIFATVLHERAGARLVGERTFGHSGRHVLIPLSNGARVQLTDAFYSGPDREPIDESLQPDLRVRDWGMPPSENVDEGAEEDDPVLDAALDELLADDEPAEEPALAA